MKTTLCLALGLFAMAVTPSVASAGDDATPARARVGEVRMFVLDPANRGAVEALHREGWLEARGEVLPTNAFEALFKAIGRAWTADGVTSNRFAVPDLGNRAKRSESSSSRNPYGVLGPGDLVTGGRGSRVRPQPVAFWIFTGQDVSRLGAGN
jgi:hypothetical protein